ncbi:hypothetical protein [Micromonospora sp. NPDC005220]|uniref:hypothetical protein n=1 Tax=Micromonospora sp. NPDC005220 TaxID=3155589 RepID=UPI0033B1B22E
MRRVIGGAVIAAALVLPSVVAVQPAAAGAVTVPVTVSKSQGVPGVRIAKKLSEIYVVEREAFTRRAITVADNNDEHAYNVIIMNLAQDYSVQLTGVHFFATMQFEGVFYGLWIAEGGTFRNKGDGGYNNWAFVGQFTRSGPDGKIVHFH